MKPARTPRARAAAALCALALSCNAAAVPSLQEFLFNVNGTTYHDTLAVPGLNAAGFDDTTGLGTLALSFSPGAPGAYYFDAFFDHQLHVPFYNEYGAVGGAPGPGISWQIDEPGFGDGNRLGTIFDNTSNNALDNTSHVPGTLSNFLGDCGANTPNSPPNAACNNDVSMALGFNFILGAGEEALITLTASTTMPTGGFFLEQIDPDSPSAVFLVGRITVLPAQTVPEPGTLLLLAVAVAAFGGMSLRNARTRA